MHANYIHDHYLAASFDYKKSLVINPNIDVITPLNWNDQTNHILADQSNPILSVWTSLKDYIERHDMKLNYEKTKVMLFHRGRKYDFTPKISTKNGEYLEVTM